MSEPSFDLLKELEKLRIEQRNGTQVFEQLRIEEYDPQYLEKIEIVDKTEDNRGVLIISL